MQWYLCGLLAQTVLISVRGCHVFKCTCSSMDGKIFVPVFCILCHQYLSNLTLCTSVCFCMGNVASEQLSVLSMYYQCDAFWPWSAQGGLHDSPDVSLKVTILCGRIFSLHHAYLVSTAISDSTSFAVVKLRSCTCLPRLLEIEMLHTSLHTIGQLVF